MNCVVCLVPKPAALMHNDEGYCVDHYRAHPDTVLSLSWHRMQDALRLGIDVGFKV